MSIEIHTLPPETHVCTSFRRGDWVVFRCPICTGYERKVNLINGKTVVKGITGALHTGSGGEGEDLKGLLKNTKEN